MNTNFTREDLKKRVAEINAATGRNFSVEFGAGSLTGLKLNDVPLKYGTNNSIALSLELLDLTYRVDKLTEIR